MGDVGGELFVGVDPVVERRDHAAQRLGQPADLVGPRGEVGDADAAGVDPARVLVAADLGGGGEVGERVGDGRGQHHRETDGDQDGDDEHLQDLLALGAHQLVDQTARARQRDRADHLVVDQERARRHIGAFAVGRADIGDAGVAGEDIAQ